MFEIRATDLVVDTTALAKSGSVATAFEYTDEQVTTPTALSRYRGRGNSLSRDYNHTKHSPVKMASGYAVSPEPPALFVRAMYDYDADDHTSLSFRRGDIIQVLNQLETGWWDGVMDDVRGWFPSNYCTPITEHRPTKKPTSARTRDWKMNMAMDTMRMKYTPRVTLENHSRFSPLRVFQRPRSRKRPHSGSPKRHLTAACSTSTPSPDILPWSSLSRTRPQQPNLAREIEIISLSPTRHGHPRS